MSAQGDADARSGLMSTGDWPLKAVVHRRAELSGGLTAPRRARVLARDLLGPCLNDRARNDMLVLVTELVTNAVRHAGVGPDEVVVGDGGRGFEPVEREPGPNGGFGLVLLRTMPDRWGLSADDGTCVWFEMDR